jgi:hypothetical protein
MSDSTAVQPTRFGLFRRVPLAACHEWLVCQCYLFSLFRFAAGVDPAADGGEADRYIFTGQLSLNKIGNNR